MKNHFYMSYFGNKRMEIENIYNNLNLQDVEIIIEPFCGSCSMSYYISLKHPKKFKYILNDNDPQLFDMYNIIISDEKTKEFEEEIEKKLNYINCDKIKYNEIVKQKNVYSWFIAHKFYSIRPGLFPLTNKFNNIKLSSYPIYNFFRDEDIIYIKGEANEIYKTYKNNEKSLILMDPPYLSSYNTLYNSPDVNIYTYLYNNQIINEKAKIYLILENMWIIKLLFQKYKKLDVYEKLYQNTKRQTTHIIVVNKLS